MSIIVIRMVVNVHAEFSLIQVLVNNKGQYGHIYRKNKYAR